MPVLSANLKAQADLQNTKAAWSAKVIQLLGPDRRLRGIRDADASAANPAATGVEFLNIGSSGTIPTASGNISGFGTLSNPTKRQPVDLSTGKAVLVLEGGGESIMYTLGLPGSGAEFIIARSPTGSNDEGLSFSAGSGMRAPVLLDSGTGPLSPSLDATIVVAARLCAWNTGARVVVGTINFNKREPNLVMDHPWQAREFGDIKRYRTADNGHLIWGTGGDSFQWGGELLLSNKVTNGEVDKPLQQLRIRCRVDTTQRWSNYPFRGGFVRSTDTMAPPAHKWELLNGNGDIVDVIELYQYRDANNTPGSGWPVNDPRIHQRPDLDKNKPANMMWSCRMLHFWQSNTPKDHSLLNHFVSGVDANSMSPRNVYEKASDPEQWPVFTDNDLLNGLGSLSMAPKWPRGKGHGFDTTIINPYFASPEENGNYTTQWMGYGFQPASDGLHGWYMAPGGARHYRAGWPTGLVSWASERNGARVHGNVPWREIAKHWMLNYFNHAHHYYKDVNTGEGVKASAVDRNGAAFAGQYYGDTPAASDPNRGIELFVFTANAHAFGNPPNPNLPMLDKNGNRLSNEYARDSLHSMNTAATGTYMTISPAHAVEAAHSFISHLICSRDQQPLNKYDFMVRSHVWHNWQFLNMWIASSNHPESFTMLEVERIWAEHLEGVCNSIRDEYESGSTLYGASLKRFGIYLRQEQDAASGVYIYSPASDLNSKVFYAAQLYMLMKQSGAYDKMRAYSAKCAWTIDTWFECLSRYAIDMIVDGGGRYDRYDNWCEYKPLDGADFPGQWKFYGSMVGGIEGLPPTWDELYPKVGLSDWMTYYDGRTYDYKHPQDSMNTKHLRAQWLWMMKTHYPELLAKFPRHAAAVAKIDDWYASVEAIKDTQYWNNRFSTFGKFGAPARLGAPI